MLTVNTAVERACVELYCDISDCLHSCVRNISKLLQDVSGLLSIFSLKMLIIFIYRLEDVKLYGNASESQAAMYDRDHPRYPYKSHGQWLKAAYGMVACLILLIFNGVAAFLEDPFDTRRFIASYIGVSSSRSDFLPTWRLHRTCQTQD